MTALAPINPAYAQGQTVAAGAVSAQATVNTESKQLCITNLGSNVAYIRVGSGVFAATTADMPILAGSQVSITKGDGDNKIAYISADGTSLHVIPGEGF
jgi:hypothetical protein